MMEDFDESPIEFDFEGFESDCEIVNNENTLIELKKEIAAVYRLSELDINIKYEPLEENIRSDIKSESLDLDENFIESDDENSDPLHISQEDRLMLRKVPVSENWNVEDFESDEEIQLKKLRESRFPIVLVEKLSFTVIKDAEGKCLYLTVQGKEKDKMFCRIPSQMSAYIKSISKYSLSSLSFVSQIKFKEHNNTSVASSSKHLEKTTYLTNNRGLKCLHCDFSTIDVITLNSHALNHLESELNCSECDFRADTKKELENHIQSHSNSKTFQCFECDYKTSIKSNIKTHLLIHYDLEIFKCFQCSFECRTKDDLQLHLLEHSETRVFKCSLCTYESNSMKNLEEHLSSHSNESRLHLNKKLHRCSECKYFTNIKSNLRRHLRCHSDLKLYDCHQCHYKCNMKATLNKHLLWHSRKLRCHLCNYSTENKSSLKSHFVVHYSTKMFNCPKCSFNCKRKGDLRSHMQRKHNNATLQIRKKKSKSTNENKNDSNKKLFECPHCKFSHFNRTNLMSHLITHVPQKLYKCFHCNIFNTNYITSLRSHLVTHSVAGVSPKLFKCSVCHFETNYEVKLKYHHEEIHPNSSFKFSSCKYLTVDKNKLLLNLLNNSDKKLYRCSDCNYGAKYKTCLKSHIESYHKKPQEVSKLLKCQPEELPIKRFGCPRCSYSSTNKGYFMNHLLIHSSKKFHTCSICTYSTKYKRRFRNHLLSYHKIRSQDTLNKGEKTTEPTETDCEKKLKCHRKEYLNKSFDCPHCTNSSDNENNFLTHLVSHTGGKLKCLWCDYETKYKKCYRNHVAAHHKTSQDTSLETCKKTTKMLKCYLCDYQTDSKEELKRHREEHLNKSFKCHHCNYSSGNQNQLMKHLLIHSRKKIYKCSFCTYTTLYNKCLRYHVICYHKTRSQYTSKGM